MVLESPGGQVRDLVAGRRRRLGEHRDEVAPEHPYAVGERYAYAIPGAELVSEEPGASPLAWRGGQLSRVIAGLAGRVAA